MQRCADRPGALEPHVEARAYDNPLADNRRTGHCSQQRLGDGEREPAVAEGPAAEPHGQLRLHPGMEDDLLRVVGAARRDQCERDRGDRSDPLGAGKGGQHRGEPTARVGVGDPASVPDPAVAERPAVGGRRAGCAKGDPERRRTALGRDLDRTGCVGRGREGKGDGDGDAQAHRRHTKGAAGRLRPAEAAGCWPVPVSRARYRTTCDRGLDAIAKRAASARSAADSMQDRYPRVAIP